MNTRLLSALATVLVVAAGIRLASLIIEPILPSVIGLLVVAVALFVAVGRGPRLPK